LDEVQEFYDKNAQNEWDRLDRHRTEFAVTLRALKDYLPHLPVEVLDVGGGPGRYSIALAKLGHRVTLRTFPRVAFTSLRKRPRKPM
jgi:2-polyprenyl-3-methyl-5-hydroxy-6-metoxy-1,4-benzoquinol methylase